MYLKNHLIYSDRTKIEFFFRQEPFTGLKKKNISLVKV